MHNGLYFAKFLCLTYGLKQPIPVAYSKALNFHKIWETGLEGLNRLIFQVLPKVFSIESNKSDYTVLLEPHIPSILLFIHLFPVSLIGVGVYMSTW